MSDKVIYTKNGISLSTALFITFLVLKLCNVITWSWWWVTAPLWISAGLAILFVIFYILILAFIALIIRK